MRLRVALLLLFCPAVLSTAPASSGGAPVPLAEGTPTRPVQLSRIVVKFQRGESFGSLKQGLLCIGGGRLAWKTGRHALDIEEFDDAFVDVLREAGFNVVAGTGEMFDTGEDQKAEYLIGGNISAMTVDACLPHSGLGDGISAKGKAMLRMEWYVYSRLSRSVVARIPTSATFTRGKVEPDGVSGLVVGAFVENLKAALRTGTFHKLLIGAPQDMTVARGPTGKWPPLALPFPRAPSGSLPQVVGSTVLVQSGDGHGSGFLISSNGYFLTNRHVVGGAKFVKLRWSDGLEGLGEVIRSDSGRDIALIKGEARGRAPLRIYAGTVPVGTEVFAVGAPLDRRLQNSVTKGIVSANRVLDGYSFIQSDVSVQHGNSGGPLVDAKGDVVGVAVSGMENRGAPLGLNFFIPAAESLAFLSVVPVR
jgi:serine protease Do